MTRKKQEEEPTGHRIQRVGIAGLGKRGLIQMVLTGLNPGAKIAALYDPDDRFASLFRQSFLENIFYSDISAMMNHSDLDALFVCTPSKDHLSIVEKCRKHKDDIRIYIEAPLADSLDSAAAILKQKSGETGRHALGFVYPHKSVFKEAKHLINRRSLENIKRFRASLYHSYAAAPDSLEKGILLREGFSLIHLLIWCFGLPESVSARTTKGKTGAESGASLILNYSSGLLGLVDLSWNRPGYPRPAASLNIEGTRGIMEITEETLKLYLYRPLHSFQKGWTSLSSTDLGSTEPVLYCEEGLYAAHHAFLSSPSNVRASGMTWEDGYNVHRTIQAAALSAESGRPFFTNEVQ